MYAYTMVVIFIPRKYLHIKFAHKALWLDEENESTTRRKRE